MEITGSLENGAISFCENGAVLFLEIGAVFGIVPRLLNWAILAGPHWYWRHSWLGFPSECAVGPDNMSPRPFQYAPVIWACPVLVQSGPITWARGMLHWHQSLGHLQWLGARPKYDLARALASRSPEDKMRSYPPPLRAIRIRFESWLSDNHEGLGIPI